MARTVRDADLRTREKRLNLKAGRRYWRGIHDGLALCYRRGKQGSGTWSYRYLQTDGTYKLGAMGAADDYADANGADVLTFKQAQHKAIEVAEQAKRDGGRIVGSSTVNEAIDHYLTWFRQHRKSVKETEHTIRVHIRPAFGERRIADVKAPELRAWLNDLAAQPARVRSARLSPTQRFKAAPKTADEKRARRSTANRILSVLKAVLNKAFEDGLVSDNREWQKVLPFERADEARIRFLSDAEAVRLVNACPADLRSLVQGALLTGARFGELAGLRVQDVDVRAGTVYFAPAKSGKARHVPLNPEGAALFRESVKGKTADALLFTRADGSAWGKNHHVRALVQACKAAKIKPSVAFHELRHTYASHLAQAGVDLLAISKLLGHADTRITAKHYAHLADKTLAAAVTKLPSFQTAEPILAPVARRA